jgi:hypothetical protein
MLAMIHNHNMGALLDPAGINKNYYLLVDNDMILGKNWDSIFISAIESYHSKDLYFLTQYPGGITGRGRMRDPSKTDSFQIKDMFKNDSFEFITASRGGSSGMWFMNIEMLHKLIWSPEDYRHVLKKFKRQDSVTWSIISSRHGKDFKYVGAVVPEPGKPYVVHIGDFIGSICRSETIKNYKKEMPSFYSKEEIRFKNKSHIDIYEEFKMKGSEW